MLSSALLFTFGPGIGNYFGNRTTIFLAGNNKIIEFINDT